MYKNRNADLDKRHIDYCLNILGIRVWEASCQLIAKGDGEWASIGPKWDLPVHIPRTKDELRDSATDTLRITAWQYELEHRGTDIREVLSQDMPFSVALERQADRQGS